MSCLSISPPTVVAIVAVVSAAAACSDSSKKDTHSFLMDWNQYLTNKLFFWLKMNKPLFAAYTMYSELWTQCLIHPRGAVGSQHAASREWFLGSVSCQGCFDMCTSSTQCWWWSMFKDPRQNVHINFSCWIKTVGCTDFSALPLKTFIRTLLFVM